MQTDYTSYVFLGILTILLIAFLFYFFSSEEVKAKKKAEENGFSFGSFFSEMSNELYYSIVGASSLIGVSVLSYLLYYMGVIRQDAGGYLLHVCGYTCCKVS